MQRGSRFLARQAIRQLIWEVFNRHTPSPMPDIALMGSRRSGSTLLMQAIAQNKGVKSVNQPFSYFTATAHQMQFLPWPAGGFYFNPGDEERARLENYLNLILTGELHVQEPWRIWQKSFSFRSNRIVLKTTDAHYLEAILGSSGCRIVRYFRHPVAQSLSCLRNKWDDKLVFFHKAAGFRDGYLTEGQNHLFSDVLAKGAPLERYVLGWCLENLPLFSDMGPVSQTVFYEDLILNGAEVLKTIAAHCDLKDLTAMQVALGKPSVSVKGLSDQNVSVAIKTGDHKALVSRWCEQVTEKELGKLQHILDQFPGCPYRAADPLPLAQGG